MNPPEPTKSNKSLDNLSTKNSNIKKLWIVSIVCFIFMVIELIGGYLASSIAIMSDAAHMLSDLLGFLISIFSIYISQKKADKEMSYGYHRAEVIGALVSINIIWGLTFWLLWEATYRIIHPTSVNGLIMLITAVIGFVFNIIMGLILYYENIELRINFHDHGHQHGDEGGHGHSHGGGHGHSHGGSHGHSHGGGHGHSHGENHDHGKSEENPQESDPQTKPLIENNPPDDEPREKIDEERLLKYESLNDPFSKSRTLLEDHDEDAHKRNAFGRDSTILVKNISEHKGSIDDTTTLAHSKGEAGDININAAFIHIIGDAIQNLGVVIAGLIIYYFPQYHIADSICTYLFSLIVLTTTFKIMKECLTILMEASPDSVDVDQIAKDLLSVEGVQAIHDLHVWSLSSTEPALSCHILSFAPQTSLIKSSNLLRRKYKISHSTIQVESINENKQPKCKQTMH